MAETLDILGQLTVKEGADRRVTTKTISDRIVSERNSWQLTLATNTSTQLSLYSMGTDAGKKVIYAESDKQIKVHLNGTGQGVDLAPNGWMLVYTTAITAVHVENESTTDTATVEVAVYLVTTT